MIYQFLKTTIRVIKYAICIIAIALLLMYFSKFSDQKRKSEIWIENPTDSL